MAIQPIDMQTLFSQLEKVGKTQAFAQHGAQIQNAIEQETASRRAKEKHEAVEEASDAADEGPKHIHERKKSKEQEGGEQKKKNPQSDEPEAPRANTISDPSLGQHVDISG